MWLRRERGGCSGSLPAGPPSGRRHSSVCQSSFWLCAPEPEPEREYMWNAPHLVLYDTQGKCKQSSSCSHNCKKCWVLAGGPPSMGMFCPLVSGFMTCFSCFLVFCCLVNAELISKMTFVEITTCFRVLNCCPTKTKYKYEPDEALEADGHFPVFLTFFKTKH